jgi:uncharacterized protein (TIGR02266 family)
MTRARAQLLLPLRNRTQFLDQYFQKGDAEGGLFVPGELDVTLGDVVDVELSFAEEHVRFHIRAQVKWKRTGPARRSLPPGVGIEFLASEQRTQQRILAFAEGKESVSHRARDRRWHLQVDVTLRAGTSTFTGVTDDLSEGGCFVLTDRPMVVGDRVTMRLRAPGTLFGWITLAGIVAWRRVDDVGNSTGVGVELVFESDRQRAKVKKIVDHLKERMVRELKVKTPRSQPPTESE